MANDSKMGMLAGLAAVLVIAVVYYQKLPAGANAPNPPSNARSASLPASVELFGDPILFPPPSGPTKDVLLRE